MDAKPNTISYRLDAVRQSCPDLNAGWGVHNVNILSSQHRHLALRQHTQVAEAVSVLQDYRVSGNTHLLSVNLVTEMVRDHAVSYLKMATETKSGSDAEPLFPLLIVNLSCDDVGAVPVVPPITTTFADEDRPVLITEA